MEQVTEHQKPGATQKGNHSPHEAMKGHSHFPASQGAATQSQTKEVRVLRRDIHPSIQRGKTTSASDMRKARL